MKLTKIVAAGLLLAASSAHAVEGYAGIGLGISKADYDANQFASDFDDGSFTSASVDTKDTAFRFFGGVNFNQNIAVEVAYADLGKFSGQGISNGSGYLYAAGPVDFSEKVTALSLALKGSAPVNDSFGVFGKIGMARWSIDGEFSNAAFGSITGTNDGTDPYLALGLEAKLPGNLSAQVEFSRYTDVDDNVDIDTLTASLSYSFK